MIALQIKINGNQVYTAGIEDWDSLHAILGLVHGVRGQPPSLELNVSGSCRAEDPCRGDSVRWMSQYLNVNDEVSIKIIETDDADPPVKRLKRAELEKKYDPQYTAEELEKMDFEMYKKLKRKYEKDN